LLTERALKLKQVSLLSALPDDVLEPLARTCGWRDYQAGVEILSYLDVTTHVHFLIAGKVRVMVHAVNGKAIVFSDLNQGELFGELAAIDGLPRSATVTALAPVTVASLASAPFVQLLSDYPVLSMPLIRMLVANVRRLDERVLEFSTLNVQGRIQAELLRFARQGGECGSDSVLLEPAPSLSDLASRISSHREAVSRELSRLADMGLVRREPGGLRLLSLQRLASMVDNAKG
jgi:CRP/FNR family transcriptional regulator, cyclic AMP receptor protein